MNITGGKYNSRKVEAPKNDGVRPTLSKIRAGIFNSLNTFFDFENKSFLDAFSGSGIMALEAVSRGFCEVVSIEKDIKTANIIKSNFSKFDEKPKLIIKDTINVLNSIQTTFDVIFIDPPYEEQNLYQKSLDIISTRNLLNDDGIIILENKKDLMNFAIPKTFEIVKEKTYGDTVISFLKKIC